MPFLDERLSYSKVDQRLRNLKGLHLDGNAMESIHLLVEAISKSLRVVIKLNYKINLPRSTQLHPGLHSENVYLP